MKPIQEPSEGPAKLPDITDFCETYLGINPAEKPIPVLPTAHYAMGGIPTDTSGRVLLDREGTVVDGLYAAGECACVSVHGANRLASTSLLEGLVWGVRAARSIENEPEMSAVGERDVPEWDDSELSHDADPALIQGDMQTIRSLMWHYVGLLRNGYRLERKAVALAQSPHLIPGEVGVV